MKNKWAEKYIKRILILPIPSTLSFARNFPRFLPLANICSCCELSPENLEWQKLFGILNISTKRFFLWIYCLDDFRLMQMRERRQMDQKLMTKKSFSISASLELLSFIYILVHACHAVCSTRVTIYEHVLISIQLFPFNNQSHSTSNRAIISSEFLAQFSIAINIQIITNVSAERWSVWIWYNRNDMIITVSCGWGSDIKV